MGLVLLTKDQTLADYLLTDCPMLTGLVSRPSSLKKQDLCVVDADSFPPPFPESACLIIARTKQETQLPLLLRPLAPRALSDALQNKEDDLPRLSKEQKAIITQKGSFALAPLEFAILEILFENKGRTVPREKLAKCLVELECGASHAENPDALLIVYIYRLRKKLTPLGLSLTASHRKGYLLTISAT